MPGDRFIELAMTGDRHVLDVLFQHAREAITVQDAAGRLVYANDNAARLVGFKSAAEMLATPVTELAARFEMVDASGEVLPIDALPGRRVLGGEMVVEEIIGYRRRGDRRVRWSRVNASPIKNDVGQIVFAINYFLDITAQVRRDESRQLLATAHEMLGSSLDLEENLKTLAHLISPQMGSWCAVHLAEDDGTLASVVVVHSESEGEAMVQQMGEGERIPLASDRLQARVAKRGKPEVIREITEEMLQAAEAEAAEFAALARQLDLNSVFCLPLWRGNQVIGTMTVARSGPELPFDDDDIEIVAAVAERAAITLENARLYQQEHEVAELLQRGLMPRLLPKVEGMELAARYRPLTRTGHVGGDFYDVIPLSTDRFALIVGDIEGKGVAAAAAVGLARHTVRTAITIDPTPRTVIGALNQALLEEEQRMCTLAYLLLTRGDDGFDLRVTLAGHPPPIVMSPDGRMRAVGRPCPPAGVLPALEPIEVQHWLAPGESIVTYTDGFTLSDLAPPESIEKALAGAGMLSPDALLDRLLAALYEAHPHNVPDDVALLAARVTP